MTSETLASESNPKCLLMEKISTENYAWRSGQNLVTLQIRDKIHGLFH